MASSDFDFRQMAVEKLGEDYSQSFNTSENMVICVNDKDQEGFGKVDYLIFDLGKSQVLYEELGFMGTIKWENDSVIKIKRITGIPAANETGAGITYYDLVKKTNVNPASNNK